jgi:hypothetical protein
MQRNGGENPFLPVRTKEEFHVFSILMLSAEMDRFDGEKMALLWVKYIDGTLVVPKLPAHLKKYHKSWESNECIKAEMERTQNDNAILQRYLDRMLSDEFGTGGSDHLEQEENPRQAVTQITTNQKFRCQPGKPETVLILWFVTHRSTLTCGGGSVHCMDIHIH